MQIVVLGHGVEVTRDLSSDVARRALSALGGFGKRIGRVTVRLHAPASGAEALVTCHILVDIHPSGGIGIGHTAPSLESAVDGALARALGATDHELEQRGRLPERRALAYPFFE